MACLREPRFMPSRVKSSTLFEAVDLYGSLLGERLVRMPQTAHLLFGVARELVASVRCGKVRECRLGASRQWSYVLFDRGHGGVWFEAFAHERDGGTR